MATNRSRVIFPAAALFVGPTPSTGQHFSSGNSGDNLIQQVVRAQTAALNFDIPLTDVNQLGQLAALEQIILESPTVGLDISWLLVDGNQEAALGFHAKGLATFISGQLDKTQDDKNYFVLITPEGTDAIGTNAPNTSNVIAIGNGFVTNYSLDIAVGSLPTATLSIEALNAKFDTGSADKLIPAVNPLNGRPITDWYYSIPPAIAYTGADIPSALRPGDLELQLSPLAAMGNILSGAGSVNIQSINLSIPLGRETLNRLGSPFAFSRELSVPIQFTLTIEALQADLRESNLADILCSNPNNNFKIIMRKPSCDDIGEDAFVIDARGMKLQSQSFGVEVGGGAATTTMTFQGQLAGLGSDGSVGVFISGSY